MKKKLFWSLCVSMLSMVTFAQSITYEVEQLNVAPGALAGSDKCIQLGVYATSDATISCSNYVVGVSYTFPAGMVVAAPVFADPLGAFPGTNIGLGVNDGNGATLGGGDLLDNAYGGAANCASTGNVLNSVTENGNAAATFITYVGAPTVLTSVTHGSLQASMAYFTASGALFSLPAGTRTLMAVLEFPIAQDFGTGQVDVIFDVDPNTNFVNLDTGAQVDAAVRTDGYIQVFETTSCGDGTNYAVYTDDVAAANTGTTIAGDSAMSIAYREVSLGGFGGRVSASVNYGAGIIGFQIVGTDGYDSGMVPPDGTSPDALTMDALTGPSAGVTYTLTYFVLGLDGNPAAGGTCDMVVTFRDASCTAVWVNNGINSGTNSTYTVSLTNPMEMMGPTFGSVNSDGTPTGIVVPIDIIAGMNISNTVVGSDNVAVFTVIDAIIPNGDWGGTWTTSGASSPNGITTSCAAALGFVCPVMTTVSVAGPVAIGDDLVVTFDGTDALTYDVTYNGATATDVTSPHTIVGAANGGDLDVTVTANGYGPDGLPCSDSMDADVTFVDATCGAVTLVPAPPVDGYSVGDAITTIAVEITGASSVMINGVACTPSVDPNANATVTWTYPNAYTVTGPDTLVVAATNPNGVVTDCADILIEVDCTEANIESIGAAGGPGLIVIEGIEGLDYEIWYGPCGQAQFDMINGSYVGDVTIGPDVDADGLGEGSLSVAMIVADTCYYVVCPGDIIASNAQINTVPTLGEWGSAIFVVLVMFAGLVILRRKN